MQGTPLVLYITAIYGTGYPPSPVHRLDMMTSGVLLMAKHHASASNLGQQFGYALQMHRPQSNQGCIESASNMTHVHVDSLIGLDLWLLSKHTDADARGKFQFCGCAGIER